MKRKDFIKGAAGFSLVELMIALLLGMIASVGIYKTYTSFSANAAVQEGLVEMQQNLRYGMKKMATEVRRTGFDPEDGGLFGLVAGSCTSTKLKFSYDVDEDGAVDSNELITYSFDSGSNQLDRRESGGAAQGVIENVNGLQFIYLNNTTFQGYVGSTTARGVQISMVVRSTNEDYSYIDSATDYTNLYGNRIPLSNDGVALPTLGDNTTNRHFHRRVMSTKIWARNLNFNANKVP